MPNEYAHEATDPKHLSGFDISPAAWCYNPELSQSKWDYWGSIQPIMKSLPWDCMTWAGLLQ